MATADSFTKRCSSLARASLVALLIAGCVPVNAPEKAKPQPVVKTSTVWDAIASRIDGKKIETTDEVLLIVRELVSVGDLAKDEAAKVDRLGWEKSRKIQDGDADKIRGLN